MITEAPDTMMVIRYLGSNSVVAGWMQEAIDAQGCGAVIAAIRFYDETPWLNVPQENIE